MKSKTIITIGSVLVGVGLLGFIFRKNIAMIFDTYIIENKEAFLAKVKTIASQLGIQPDWLMAVMAFESGINHKAVNSTSGATGLIQFMPSTAAGMGTSTSALKAMSNVEQLDWVYKYLKPYANRMKSYIDVYLAVFFPAAMGKHDNYVIQTSTISAATIANQNPIFDINKDKIITVGEVKIKFSEWVTKRGFTII